MFQNAAVLLQRCVSEKGGLSAAAYTDTECDIQCICADLVSVPEHLTTLAGGACCLSETSLGDR